MFETRTRFCLSKSCYRLQVQTFTSYTIINSIHHHWKDCSDATGTPVTVVINRPPVPMFRLKHNIWNELQIIYPSGNGNNLKLLIYKNQQQKTKL